MLLETLQELDFDPDLIIVETLRRVMDGDEKDAQHVARFWHGVEPILVAGKTLGISHHMRKLNAKGGNAVRDRASGSTDILAGADTAFAVQRKTKDTIIIECVKSREVEEHDPFSVRLETFGQMDGPAKLEFLGACEKSFQIQDETERAAELLLEWIPNQPGSSARTLEIRGYLEPKGFSERTVERTLKMMKGRGDLESPKRGHYKVPERS